MKNTRRKFTPEERLSIVQEAVREGHTETSRKYQLSPSLLIKWKSRYLSKGLTGLKDSYKMIDPQIRDLELENERLKKIIAKQALQIEIQSELLKKTPVGSKIKIVMLEKYQDKAPMRDLCNWIMLPRSSYYYKPSERKRGFKPSI